MAFSPYREAPGKEPAARKANESSGTLAVTVFVWLVTLVRLAAGAYRSEPPSRELVLAWVVLLLAPYLCLRQIKER